MKGKISGTRATKGKSNYSKVWCDTVWVKYSIFPKLNLKFLTFLRSFKSSSCMLDLYIAPKPFWLFKTQFIQLDVTVEHESGDVNSTTSGPILSRLGLVQAEVVGYNLRAVVTNEPQTAQRKGKVGGRRH